MPGEFKIINVEYNIQWQYETTSFFWFIFLCVDMRVYEWEYISIKWISWVIISWNGFHENDWSLIVCWVIVKPNIWTIPLNIRKYDLHNFLISTRTFLQNHHANEWRKIIHKAFWLLSFSPFRCDFFSLCSLPNQVKPHSPKCTED